MKYLRKLFQTENICFVFFSLLLTRVKTIGAISDSVQDTSDLIIETVTQQTSSRTFPSGKSTFVKTTQIEDDSSQLSESNVNTPTTIPLTSTRINPFASRSAAGSPLVVTSQNNNENNTPKSVLNLIEDKLAKRNSQLFKEKDSWKPTPTRKLVKSKVSSGTPSIGSFCKN